MVHGQTDIRTDIGAFKQPEKTPRQKCEEKGGTWDAARGVCILVEKTKEDKQPLVTEVEPALETFTDPKTGRASGITTPDGRTFLGLSPEEVAAVAAGEQARAARPEGTAPVGTAQAQAIEIRRKLALARSVGTIDFELASQLEEQGLNVREFLHAGAQEAVVTAATFGVGAASVGLIGGPQTSLVAGGAAAGAGTIIGFFKGVTSNIKSQRTDLVSVKVSELAKRKRAITDYISAANLNPAAADEYKAAMDIELSLIRKDYNTLVKRGEPDLEFWGSDGTPQIVAYDIFFDSTEPALIVRMQQAILRPDPTRAFLTLEEES